MAVHLAFVEALWVLCFRVLGVALVAGFIHRRLADRRIAAHVLMMWFFDFVGGERRLR